jgi:hypothetical protein
MSSHFGPSTTATNDPTSGGTSLALVYTPSFERLENDDPLPPFPACDEPSDIFSEMARNPCFSLYTTSRFPTTDDSGSRATVDELLEASRQERTVGGLRSKVSGIENRRRSAASSHQDTGPTLTVFTTLSNHYAATGAVESSAPSPSVAAMTGHEPAIGMCADEGTLKILSNRPGSQLSEEENRRVCVELMWTANGSKNIKSALELEKYVEATVTKAKRYNDSYSYWDLTAAEARGLLRETNNDVRELEQNDWNRPLGRV